MTTPTLDRPVRPRLDRPTAMRLAEGEYRRLHGVLASLAPADWDAPTECTGWSVRDMAGHVVGSMRAMASVRELMSQQRATKARAARHSIPEVDAMTAEQIDRTASLAVPELLAEMDRLVAAATRGRRRTPAPVRRFVKLPVDVPGVREDWSLGYLVDVILTRDTWMHRVDIGRATGRPIQLTADHDRLIVADVAEEWLRRVGQPATLVLEGPAGGSFSNGTGGPDVNLDAVEFCRVMSGRAQPTHPLLETLVPF